MAKFVREGKGGVGRLIVAETSGLVKSKIDLSILSKDIPDDLDTLVDDINSSHKDALAQIGRAVIAAARAGQLLLAAKAKLKKDNPDKPFTTWLAETFDFSERTAYNYMKAAALKATRAEEFEKCESIRDVLKLCDTEEGAAKKKKKRDTKRESFITWAAKIETCFREMTTPPDGTPIEDWDQNRKDTTAKMLEGVYLIYRKLVS